MTTSHITFPPLLHHSPTARDETPRTKPLPRTPSAISEMPTDPNILLIPPALCEQPTTSSPTATPTQRAATAIVKTWQQTFRRP